MNRHRFRSSMRAFVAVLSIACFLAFAQGAVTHALAADPVTPPATPPKGTEWETWPPKKGGEASATAGEAAGARTSSGISAGTWGWIAGGTAAVILIVVLAAGGGGGGSTTTAVQH